MPTLAETQSAFRRAIAGEGAALPPIVGGPDPALRLAIHSRHYAASLARHLLGRFPATAWLTGSDFLAGVAAAFVRQSPPGAPCLAEYGEAFPAFLAAHPASAGLPWLGSLAEMDWHLGDVAVAVEKEPLVPAALAAIDPVRLPDLRLVLQPGLRYLTASWPADDLVRLYLADDRPEHFELAPAETLIEIRGARGTFSFRRMGEGDHAFRRAVAAGLPIGAAVERAGAGLEPGAALMRLFADCLVTSFTIAD
jgi:hypothetical protein